MELQCVPNYQPYDGRFFVLRDRFEQVTAVRYTFNVLHTQLLNIHAQIRRHHESALETAQSKVKDLQAECE